VKQEVSIKSMKDEMMLTGTVATAEQSAKAEEIIKGVRGVKKVRNRLRVGAVEECSKANDAELSKKIEEQIANDEELTQARRKFELTMKDRNLVTGELKDYAQAGSLINLIERALPELAGLRKLEY
jgi:Flp pilus assembly secretin CpaC